MQFNLADLLERVADTVPDHLALVCAERRLTYAELDARANRLAHVLAARGVGVGDHVALYLYNSTEYLEGMLAAFKLRAVPINVNYRYVEDELRYLLDDAEAVAVIFHREFASKLEAIRARLPHLLTFIAVDDGIAVDNGKVHPGATVPSDDYERTLAAASPARDFAPRSPDDLYLLYTGGTTGLPKGVMWRHVDLFFGAMAGAGGGGVPIGTPEEIADRCREARTRCVPICPFMHGTAHWMAFSTLFMGGTVIIPADHHFDPIAVWRLIAREQANYIVIVGDAFARPLLDALSSPEGRTLDVSRLHVVLSGGAILSPSLKRAFVDRLPALLVVDGYGASETGGQGQSIVVAGGDVPTALRFRVGADTQVLGPDLRPVGVGVVGRLARRGNIPLGYYNDQTKTAETFPVVDGVRWAVPGDHAVVETDGSITLLGRGSLSINTGGEKVYPEEVESVLKEHADVFDAVVVGVPDERFGERVVAIVQPRAGAAPRLDALRQHSRVHLAGYKIPREVVLVDTIERSPSGKPDYRWARAAANFTPGTVER
ncbi:MAG: 3-oxocholest-4-en-26-oate---CoA ligase [Actinomycetota bacterium]|jgi:acyl-CoA synthetase (AMP-forming)/AMP-acid ligase II|nr:3-oxocholest-4-en-26-oate---CoA ligase [Actinomycetota bacterium]